MTPSIILQIFKRTGSWFTLRGWAIVGGVIAASAVAFTVVMQWM